MADQIVLLTCGDAGRARRIIHTFADRTGLHGTDIAGGVSFAVGADDHRIQVVHVLTDIDPGWSQHLSLGDPQSGPPASGAA
jgi:hypothetical protein